jgi:hypothetical protein
MSDPIIFSAHDIDYLVLHFSDEQLQHELKKARLDLNTAKSMGTESEQAYYADYIEAVTMALEIVRSNRPVPAVSEAKNKNRLADPQDIKGRLDIVDVIGHYLQLKKSGKYFTACCPFHEEKSPSFFVYPEQKTYHCYGCQKHGDIFSFIQEIEHTDFNGALQILEGL